MQNNNAYKTDKILQIYNGQQQSLYKQAITKFIPSEHNTPKEKEDDLKKLINKAIASQEFVDFCQVLNEKFEKQDPDTVPLDHQENWHNHFRNKMNNNINIGGINHSLYDHFRDWLNNNDPAIAINDLNFFCFYKEYITFAREHNLEDKSLLLVNYLSGRLEWLSFKKNYGGNIRQITETTVNNDVKTRKEIDYNPDELAKEYFSKGVAFKELFNSALKNGATIDNIDYVSKNVELDDYQEQLNEDLNITQARGFIFKDPRFNGLTNINLRYASDIYDGTKYYDNIYKPEDNTHVVFATSIKRLMSTLAKRVAEIVHKKNGGDNFDNDKIVAVEDLKELNSLYLKLDKLNDVLDGFRNGKYTDNQDAMFEINAIFSDVENVDKTQEKFYKDSAIIEADNLGRFEAECLAKLAFLNDGEKPQTEQLNKIKEGVKHFTSKGFKAIELNGTKDEAIYLKTKYLIEKLLLDTETTADIKKDLQKKLQQISGIYTQTFSLENIDDMEQDLQILQNIKLDDVDFKGIEFDKDGNFKVNDNALEILQNQKQALNKLNNNTNNNARPLNALFSIIDDGDRIANIAGERVAAAFANQNPAIAQPVMNAALSDEQKNTAKAMYINPHLALNAANMVERLAKLAKLRELIIDIQHSTAINLNNGGQNNIDDVLEWQNELIQIVNTYFPHIKEQFNIEKNPVVNTNPDGTQNGYNQANFTNFQAFFRQFVDAASPNITEIRVLKEKLINAGLDNQNIHDVLGVNYNININPNDVINVDGGTHGNVINRLNALSTNLRNRANAVINSNNPTNDNKRDFRISISNLIANDGNNDELQQLNVLTNDQLKSLRSEFYKADGALQTRLQTAIDGKSDDQLDNIFYNQLNFAYKTQGKDGNSVAIAEDFSNYNKLFDVLKNNKDDVLGLLKQDAPLFAIPLGLFYGGDATAENIPIINGRALRDNVNAFAMRYARYLMAGESDLQVIKDSVALFVEKVKKDTILKFEEHLKSEKQADATDRYNDDNIFTVKNKMLYGVFINTDNIINQTLAKAVQNAQTYTKAIKQELEIKQPKPFAEAVKEKDIKEGDVLNKNYEFVKNKQTAGLFTKNGINLVINPAYEELFKSRNFYKDFDKFITKQSFKEVSNGLNPNEIKIGLSLIENSVELTKISDEQIKKQAKTLNIKESTFDITKINGALSKVPERVSLKKQQFLNEAPYILQVVANSNESNRNKIRAMRFFVAIVAIAIIFMIFLWFSNLIENSLLAKIPTLPDSRFPNLLPGQTVFVDPTTRKVSISFNVNHVNDNLSDSLSGAYKKPDLTKVTQYNPNDYNTLTKTTFSGNITDANFANKTGSNSFLNSLKNADSRVTGVAYSEDGTVNITYNEGTITAPKPKTVKLSEYVSTSSTANSTSQTTVIDGLTDAYTKNLTDITKIETTTLTPTELDALAKKNGLAKTFSDYQKTGETDGVAMSIFRNDIVAKIKNKMNSDITTANQSLQNLSKTEFKFDAIKTANTNLDSHVKAVKKDMEAYQELVGGIESANSDANKVIEIVKPVFQTAGTLFTFGGAGMLSGSINDINYDKDKLNAMVNLKENDIIKEKNEKLSANKKIKQTQTFVEGRDTASAKNTFAAALSNGGELSNYLQNVLAGDKIKNDTDLINMKDLRKESLKNLGVSGDESLEEIDKKMIDFSKQTFAFNTDKEINKLTEFYIQMYANTDSFTTLESILKKELVNPDEFNALNTAGIPALSNLAAEITKLIKAGKLSRSVNFSKYNYNFARLSQTELFAEKFSENITTIKNRGDVAKIMLKVNNDNISSYYSFKNLITKPIINPIGGAIPGDNRPKKLSFMFGLPGAVFRYYGETWIKIYNAPISKKKKFLLGILSLYSPKAAELYIDVEDGFWLTFFLGPLFTLGIGIDTIWDDINTKYPGNTKTAKAKRILATVFFFILSPIATALSILLSPLMGIAALVIKAIKSMKLDNDKNIDNTRNSFKQLGEDQDKYYNKWYQVKDFFVNFKNIQKAPASNAVLNFLKPNPTDNKFEKAIKGFSKILFSPVLFAVSIAFDILRLIVGLVTHFIISAINFVASFFGFKLIKIANEATLVQQLTNNGAKYNKAVEAAEGVMLTNYIKKTSFNTDPEDRTKNTNQNIASTMFAGLEGLYNKATYRITPGKEAQVKTALKTGYKSLEEYIIKSTEIGDKYTQLKNLIDTARQTRLAPNPLFAANTAFNFSENFELLFNHVFNVAPNNIQYAGLFAAGYSNINNGSNNDTQGLSQARLVAEALALDDKIKRVEANHAVEDDGFNNFANIMQRITNNQTIPAVATANPPIAQIPKAALPVSNTAVYRERPIGLNVILNMQQVLKNPNPIFNRTLIDIQKDGMLKSVGERQALLPKDLYNGDNQSKLFTKVANTATFTKSREQQAASLNTSNISV